MEMNERQKAMVVAGLDAGMSAKELSNFIAQLSYESNQLNKLDESFIYRSDGAVNNIIHKVPSVLREGHKAFDEARQEGLHGSPEKLANLMYGGRMGNNNSGEGWMYHGRGYIQLTGKNNYEAVGARIGVDLVNNPELAKEPAIAAKVAVDFWSHNVPEKAKEDVRAATQAVNGEVGKDFASRKKLFEQIEQVLTPEYLKSLKVPTPAMHHNGSELAPNQSLNAPHTANPHAELTNTAQTLIADATHHTQKWVADNGLQWNEQFNQAAHSVASAAHEKGMTGINLFAVNGGQIDFGQKEGFMLKTGSVETAVASNTDISKSLQAMADVDQKQSQTHSHTQQQAHTQTNERGMRMG